MSINIPAETADESMNSISVEEFERLHPAMLGAIRKAVREEPARTVIGTVGDDRRSHLSSLDLRGIGIEVRRHRYVERIRRANGQQEITFTSGSRIMFGARENGFGRGLHSVDVAVFDEAQILTVRAMDNMIPVLNTSPNPLVVYMGNPPKPGDQCEAFTEKRMHALNHDGNLLYVELAADKDADSDDREQWAKANPSYPERTSEQAIMRMRNNLSDDSFRREALGIWDETATAYAISPDLWKAAAIDDVPDGGTVSFGIDMPPDRSVLTIGAALRYADGSAIVQMANIKDARQAGTMWAVDWLAEHWPKTASVVIDAQSPAMSLLPELKKAHVKVTVTNMQEMGRACGRFLDMLKAGTLKHPRDEYQPQLAAAVKGATTRPLGQSGAIAWNKLGSDVDITPLVSTTLALYGAFTTLRHPGRRQIIGGI